MNGKTLVSFLCAILLPQLRCFPVVVSAARDLYVSPTGSDNHSGLAPKEALRSLTHASVICRPGDIVHVSSGTYHLTKTLSLKQNAAQTTWIAEGGMAYVSGGYDIPSDAWKPVRRNSNGVNVVQADVSSLNLNASYRHLFVNARRIPRARLQENLRQAIFSTSSITAYGYDLAHATVHECAADYGKTTPCCGQPGSSVSRQWQCPSNQPTCRNYVFGKHWGTCTADQRGGSENLENILRAGAELVFPQSTSPWTEPRCAVSSANATAILMRQPCWTNLIHKACGQNARGPPVYIEGVDESHISAPGQFAISGDGNTVFYSPFPAENIETLHAVLPLLEVLLHIEAGADDCTFEGFSFQYATWLRPGLADGYVEQQSGQCAVGNFSQNHDCNADYYWSWKSPGNVQVVGADGVAFKRSEFAHLGGSALDFTRSSRSVVLSCYFHDVSGSGIQIGQFQDPLAAHLDKEIVVSNNIINRAGGEYSGAAGINVGYTQNVSLLHNDVSNLTYVPITMGWGWSRHECWNCTNAGNNTISWNRVYDYKQTLNDGGGIYMLGPQNGTVISENWVHDQGTASSGALYPDEGSAYSFWRRNVVMNIGRSEWLHLWTSSIHDVVVEENFADTHTYLNRGTNCPMLNNTIFSPGAVPPVAAAIINASGVSSQNPWHCRLRLVE